MAEAVELIRRGGFVGNDSWFVAHLGWLARLQGRFDLALQHGRAAAAQASLVPQAWFSPTADALLAGTMLDCGDVAGAAAVLRGGLAAAGPEGAEAYRLRCLAPLAEATGDPAVLAEAERLLGGIQTPPGGAFVLGADAYPASPARGCSPVIRAGPAPCWRRCCRPRDASSGSRCWSRPGSSTPTPPRLRVTRLPCRRPSGPGHSPSSTGWRLRCRPAATPLQRRRRRWFLHRPPDEGAGPWQWTRNGSPSSWSGSWSTWVQPCPPATW
jgi:hypothetical protein